MHHEHSNYFYFQLKMTTPTIEGVVRSALPVLPTPITHSADVFDSKHLFQLSIHS